MRGGRTRASFRSFLPAPGRITRLRRRASGGRGPALGRPLVDTISGSRHANMKELRPRGGNLRVLFAFDPRRLAILLIGGDKSGEWNAWYQRMIPLADDLYDEHLATLKREGLLP